MPDTKRALQVASRPDNETVKPTPPEDLWERMNELHVDANVTSYNDPGFTVQEYAKRYGLPHETARNRLNRFRRNGQLIAGWRIRSSGGGGRERVYRFPDEK